jgi:hypothetical protein
MRLHGTSATVVPLPVQLVATTAPAVVVALTPQMAMVMLSLGKYYFALPSPSDSNILLVAPRTTVVHHLRMMVPSTQVLTSLSRVSTLVYPRSK